jgi:hypothetical protein
LAKLHKTILMSYFHFFSEPYAKTKDGVAEVMRLFNLTNAIKKARPEIKEIFREKTLAFPDESSIETNQRHLLSFLNDEVVILFDEHIGYTVQTFELGIWPDHTEADIILKILEFRLPGLAYRKNQHGRLIPNAIRKAFLRKIND